MPTYSSYNSLGSSVEAGELSAAVTADLADKGGHGIFFPWQKLTIVQGTWAFSSNTSWGTYIFLNTSDSDADEMTSKMYLSAGTYTVITLYQKNTDSGKFNLEIDGTPFVTAQDTYNGSAAYNQLLTTTSVAVATGGIKDIGIKVNGKHASSSGHVVRIQALIFIRTA